MAEAAFGATVLTAVGLVTMVALSRRRPARWPLGALSALFSASVAAGLTAIVFRTGYGGGRLFLLLCLPLLTLQAVFRRNHWPARLFLGSLMVTGSVYLVAATQATFGGGLPPLGFGPSLALLALEVLAILVSIVFSYEIAEAVGRDNPEPPPPTGSAAYCPKVCVQVPACNEPPELLRETLEALARVPGAEGLVLPVLDAHRGEVAGALYRIDSAGGAACLIPPVVAPPEVLLAQVAPAHGPVFLLGDGLARYREVFVSALGTQARTGGPHLHPRAATVGAVALPRMLAGERTALAALRPVYGRRPVGWPGEETPGRGGKQT